MMELDRSPDAYRTGARDRVFGAPPGKCLVSSRGFEVSTLGRGRDARNRRAMQIGQKRLPGSRLLHASV